jgi:hypothetical protein
MVTRVVGDKERDGEDARGGGIMVVMGHGLCVIFVCVERPQKISWDLKNVIISYLGAYRPCEG